jgi:hypothetical protein
VRESERKDTPRVPDAGTDRNSWEKGCSLVAVVNSTSERIEGDGTIDDGGGIHRFAEVLSITTRALPALVLTIDFMLRSGITPPH